MRKIGLAIAAVVALSGCVSKKSYDQLVLEQQRVTEQKDSLVADVLAATQMVTEINTDLARVKALGVSPVAGGDRPLAGRAEERAVLLGKVREVIARLDAAEQQIEAQKKRIGGLSAERTKLVAQLDTFQKSINDLRTAAQEQEAMITEQKVQIATLTSKVDTLNQKTAQLTTEKTAVQDTLVRVIDESHVVYYAVGTKDELLKRGILVTEGSKFLVFGSKTLQPARDLKPELFQRLDRRRDTVLTVPEPNKEYRIVTRQSASFLASTVMSNGKVKGDLHISSPEFWDGGKFLILVRD
jgi:outer membrane murein-binding lipoprotein Lpp